MNDCDARVIAMAFDCEGTIGISKIGGHRCIIGNTELKLLQHLQQLSDGAGSITGPYSRGPHKDNYVWALSAGDIFTVLKAITPHLILKQQQAKLLMGMRAAKARGELIDYTKCWEVMRKLNGNSARGRPPKQDLPPALDDDI